MGDESAFFPAFDTCPACGTEGLLPVRSGGAVNFACTTCGCCWHLELGWVSRLDPGSCPACVERGICLGVVVVDLRDQPAQADSRRD